MAVDLAKLSLWLATLAKDHPFTFLDHTAILSSAWHAGRLKTSIGFRFPTAASASSTSKMRCGKQQPTASAFWMPDLPSNDITCHHLAKAARLGNPGDSIHIICGWHDLAAPANVCHQWVEKAGEGTRTLNIQLGRLTLYRWATPAT
jgi:hypothetical protein